MIYTDIPELQEAIIDIQTILAAVVFLDVLQGLLVGVNRGLGIFKQTIIGQIIMFYFFCIPLQIMLVFYFDMGIRGIWLGMMITLIILDLYYSLTIRYLVNWKDQS